ncbi:hypothetical protein HYH03_010804 [Edaphochlamys debaryana]|uniref:Protein kinase domain-containing protein n=1 Tax=Edaphochlamys debaryana TaxID=47281 RepID=A0A836BWE2_9CHLO|nr:hypothetical protein HYH03_010804 [Edaphochlamys debaryana]|eukprot:KAG2490887.1 hypothetical protein HYH03_010804 [Edaphochlamys debaryana]
MLRLKREVTNQCRLLHTHVCRFFEVGLTAEQPASAETRLDGRERLYLVFEFADSGTLQQHLARSGGRLDETWARWFMQQLVFGLAHSHARGVFNRDIKPENLLLDGSSGAMLLKVSDFGLCKACSESLPNSRVGSPVYMAPEVLDLQHGGRYDGRKADVFSCGATLFQMLFGVPPYNRHPADKRTLDHRNHADFKQLIDNMRHERWLALLPSGVEPPGPELAGLLAGMLRFDPNQRMSLGDVKRHAWYQKGLSADALAVVLADEPPNQEPQAQLDFTYIMDRWRRAKAAQQARYEEEVEAGVYDD